VFFRTIELENSFFYLLGNLLLVASVFLLSKLVLTVLLIISKLVLWLKVIHIFCLDYGDNFSPVAKMSFVCLFIAMTTLQRWPLYQLDVKNVFLNGDLEEEIYMEQPPGFVAQGESSGLVCCLHKSLYGLTQSPRTWFGKFNSVVQQFGRTHSEADHSVFYRHSRAGSIYLVVYVNDNHDIS